MGSVRAAGAGRPKSGLAVGDPNIKGKPHCPKELLNDDKYAIDAWHSNLEVMFERGSFSTEDIPHLINYCNSIGKVIKIEKQLAQMEEFTDVTASGGLKLHPLVNAHNIFTNQSLKLAAQLGLTPMARARMISGGKGEEGEGEFDEF
ncbi:P27 family phage terminase small subunit [Pseudoalteromonas sp. S16_S37]|uniref:P27 family phage terminase small subunit n=1 Tax=Pseudoalteromonas sp. S16_S37 TaxID=2720228 RepID=UPI001681AC43|nr:P27 family phage terminase small subunit [Pseudoalteromonas sp. S16_S37]MBD1583489.1 P27 family phage terminase small subunit [Pseudoalteromonas sp. S16_S37]